MSELEAEAEFDSEDPRIDSSSFLEPESESFVEHKFEPGLEPESVFDNEDPRIDSSSFLEPESEPGFVFDNEDPRIDSSSFLEPESEPGFEPGPSFSIVAPTHLKSIAIIAGLTAKKSSS